MQTLYLYPASCGTSSGTVAATIGSTPSGQIVFVNCDRNGARLCEATISTGLVPNVKYFMLVRSIYHNSSVTIRAFNVSTQLNIIGAQTEVDSTGKVGDVIRRVQVRVPNTKTYSLPDFAVQTADSICKQVRVAPSNVYGIGDSPGAVVVAVPDGAGICNL